MKTIKQYPTQEELKTYFDYDNGNLKWKLSYNPKIIIGKIAGNIHPGGYKMIQFMKSSYFVHRLIWIWHNGNIDKDVLIDHIDGNPLNNIITNLQPVTNSQNCMKQKMKSTNTTGHTGVYLKKNRWLAMIRVNSELKHLGYYQTIQEAIIVRKNAEIKYFGQYHPV